MTVDKDHFDEKTFIDKQTGVITRKYFYKRKPCNRMVLDSRIARQLAGYTLIDKDLRNCLLWLDEIEFRYEKPKSEDERFGQGKDRASYIIIKGLFVAALTFYAKCFVACEGRRIKLERAQVDEIFLKMHDSIMLFRHNFAAHSGAERLERARVALAYTDPNPKSGKVAIKVFTELDQPDVFMTREGEIGFRQLVEHVRERVCLKRNELAERVRDVEALAELKGRLQAKNPGQSALS